MIAVTAGLDHALVGLSVSYGRRFSGRDLFGFVEAGQSSALLLSGNYRVSTGVHYWPRLTPWLVTRVTGRLAFSSASNEAGRYGGLGYGASLTPFVELKRFGLGVHADLQHYLLSHIRHSERSRQDLYADARDGWYATSALTLRLGGVVSHTLGPGAATEVALNAGYQTSGRYDRLLPNLYLLLTVNYYF